MTPPYQNRRPLTPVKFLAIGDLVLVHAILRLVKVAGVHPDRRGLSASPPFWMETAANILRADARHRESGDRRKDGAITRKADQRGRVNRESNVCRLYLPGRRPNAGGLPGLK